MKKILYPIFIYFFLCWNVEAPSLERRSSAPYISGDTFRSFCNFCLDEDSRTIDPSQVKDGDLIFVKTEYLMRFFSKIHPEISAHYVLITHNSDIVAPCLGTKKCSLMKYLDDPHLIAWFGFNLEETLHHKLHTIPLGIANQYLPYGNFNAVNEAREISLNQEKTILLYGNFSQYSYRNEREYVFNLFKDKNYCSYSSFKPFEEYLKDVAKAKFVLSPRGYVLDCYRTWEAMLLGAIPIIKTSPLDFLYKGLPVLIVNDWEEISEEFLIEQYDIIKNTSHDMEKLYIFYWIDLIQSYALPFKDTCKTNEF